MPAELDFTFLKLEGALESRFLRGATVALLLAVALRFFLGRYEMLYNEHGTFLVVWITWDLNFGLPLQWLLDCGLSGRRRTGLDGPLDSGASMALALVVAFLVPPAFPRSTCAPTKSRSSAPTSRRISTPLAAPTAWSSAVREVEFKAQPEAPIDVAHHKPTLDNVRLWDWHAFHDTVTQIQALRPYYVFHDSDVDR